MNCLRLKPEGPALLLRLEPKSKKFPILTASAKAFRNRSDFIFFAQADTRTADLRLKPEANHKQKKPEAIHEE